MNILRWLLSTQLKPSQKQNKNSGFTLIELLVAMILAFLVITPLLGFMISVLTTDGQEQAKANSEQEIKAALDYITRDLQQALYIYDATGIACLSGTANTITCPNATANQLPPATDRVPVLVFWKREFTKDAVETKNAANEVLFKDDSFVYSLVAYYLVKDSNATWSKAARIARWQIKDGDVGFQAFDLSKKGITLQAKMNSWTNSLAGGTYNQDPVVLVDFVDQTTIAQETPAVLASAVTCPTTPTGFQLVPATATIVRRGFYACVNSVGADNRSAVEVYLRGNAQARLIQNDETKVRYADSKSSYFPSANIKVQGSSFIFTK